MTVPHARLVVPALLAAAWALSAGAAQAAVAAAPPASPAPLGPPAICHPIDIGDARSLPWDGRGAFARRADYDVKDVVEDTRAILRGTPDTLVHMETVRRAVIYLTGAGGGEAGEYDDAWREREVARLVESLKADVVDALLDDGDDAEAARRVALSWFDAGYALCALDQAGRRTKAGGSVEGLVMLEKSAALLPDDGALRLGLSIAHFGGGRPGRACYTHLDKALAAADDPDGLLRRNVLHTMGSFLGATEHDELVAKVRAALERA